MPSWNISSSPARGIACVARMAMSAEHARWSALSLGSQSPDQFFVRFDSHSMDPAI
ncbi:MAG: hypothetical protein BWY99_02676 [Synergistetes bacterium ADurb.BinA166]|nr:MAG: hypothetical protein BWY99_02677 [Synergistetes bacterium ADurb.BinA166]OPZ34068.1 MAG: hypothetical protein BWY99_02676 [Synergistetes bacterium ADurb.BinA166]